LINDATIFKRTNQIRLKKRFFPEQLFVADWPRRERTVSLQFFITTDRPAEAGGDATVGTTALGNSNDGILGSVEQDDLRGSQCCRRRRLRRYPQPRRCATNSTRMPPRSTYRQPKKLSPLLVFFGHFSIIHRFFFFEKDRKKLSQFIQKCATTQEDRKFELYRTNDRNVAAKKTSTALTTAFPLKRIQARLASCEQITKAVNSMIINALHRNHLHAFYRWLRSTDFAENATNFIKKSIVVCLWAKTIPE